jgi:hypothetical protein
MVIFIVLWMTKHGEKIRDGEATRQELVDSYLWGIIISLLSMFIGAMGMSFL